VADGDPQTANAQPGPLAFRTYLIRVANSDWTSGAGVNELYSYSLSPANAVSPGQADVRDNDATLLNTIPTIVAGTEFNAKNIHDYDFGFVQCNPEPLQDVTLNCSTLSAVIGPLPSNGYTYSWTPPNGLSATNIAQPSANPSSTTTYTLTTNTFCIQTMTVTVDNLPPPADAGPSARIGCDSTIITIGTPAVAGNTYAWSPANGLSNPNDAQTVANPAATTTYTLTVTGSNTCTSASTVTVTVDKCCTQVAMPNSFSPNGDKLNDDFGVIEIRDLHDFKLQVYNRFGERVFYSTTKDNRWNGKYKGKDCDLGTYFYLLTYECGEQKKQLQGDVNLIR
jgi:gliding motility-associated-like protein